ncbi:MAG: dihydropteroate synthase [Ignavibacteriales bacterium]|nr:dihydropteroate synthase [Ignavibacteriales bacterium]
MGDFYNQLLNSKVPLVMGILNVTPDSFSDGGKFSDKNSAVDHALKMIDSGADIIDIGGESTRPGSDIISAEEEFNRVIPVLRDIRKIDKQIIISIDSFKSKIIERSLEFVIEIVNDISAGMFDNNIFEIVKNNKLTYVLMHMKGTPKNMQVNPNYHDVVKELYDFFELKIIELFEQGIQKIIVDPGIGFGKRVKDNFQILNKLDNFKKLSKPLLIGLSKKSFLGKSLNIDVTERDNSTIISETIAALKGAKIIRTHNVKNTVELKKIFNFITEPELLNV